MMTVVVLYIAALMIMMTPYTMPAHIAAMANRKARRYFTRMCDSMMRLRSYGDMSVLHCFGDSREPFRVIEFRSTGQATDYGLNTVPRHVVSSYPTTWEVLGDS